MSVNWVMLSPTDDFVRLPSEQKIYASPSRVSIALSSLNKYPGRQPYNLSSNSGQVFLTNRRIIYIPSTPPPTTSNQTPPTQLASFAAPLTHVHDSHVATPWFGPNTWVAMVQPVLGGGLPTQHPVIELKLTFKEGGAYDFHEKFCRVLERLAQVREMGADTQTGRGGRVNGASDANVNLEQLPAYEERASGQSAVTGQQAEGDLIQLDDDPDESTDQNPAQSSQTSHEQSQSSIPADPPPGYEETQRDSVAELLESNLSMSDR